MLTAIHSQPEKTLKVSVAQVQHLIKNLLFNKFGIYFIILALERDPGNDTHIMTKNLKPNKSLSML